MPPRPIIKDRQGRPVSALYIGKASSPNLQDLTQSPHFSSTYPSLIDGTPPALPDLPEPPSPGSSAGSVKNGLPSPPATNSTGSGSTGDPATVRERPVSLHSNSSTSTSSSSHHTIAARSANAPNSRSSSRLGNVAQEDTGAEGDFDDDYDKENDNDNESNADGDDTARMDLRLLSSRKDDRDRSKSSTENVMALQRVRSLAQRNRLALDKLSRLGSPSPGRSNTPNTHSPAPSASSSRLLHPPRQARSATDSSPQASQELGRSGSETERESSTQYTSTHSHSSHSSSSHSRAYSMTSPHHRSATLSSSNRSTTPPPPGTPHHHSPYNRYRHLSAPGSPDKARSAATSSAASSTSNSNSSSSPSTRRRHRQSMASMSQLQLTDFEEEEDGENDNLRTATGTRTHTRDRTLNERDLITQSALAAVASSRRSPVGARRRGALPKEFRADLVEQSPSPRPGSVGRRRTQDVYESKDNYDREIRRDNWKSTEPMTPSRPSQNFLGRSATLRETRRHGAPSPRWSDDFRTPSTLRDRNYTAMHSTDDLHAKKERRQSLRGGSAESALWSPGGRSLLGEGLRAAGLSRRKDDERAQGDLSATTVSFKDSPRRVDWSPQDVLDQGRRRAFADRERDRQSQRPSTSMAHYQYVDRNTDDEQERDGGSGGRDVAIRSHKSSYPLGSKDHAASLSRQNGDQSVSKRERDSLPPERAASSMARYSTGMTLHTSSPAPTTPAHLMERSATGSPFGTRRYTQPPLSNSTSQSNSEHTRLLIESLAMFEAQLGKLPPQLGASISSSSGIGAPHSELSRNAQGTVYAAERLASMLKLSSARAMEAQVEAEVDSTTRDRSQDIIDIWSRVASDYREGSRAADELVRTLTSVLLCVGRIMRDFSASTASEMGSPSVHGRNASLGEDDLDIRSGSGSGRQSVASRTSWEPAPRDRERDREEALRRLDGGARPESVLARTSPATFQRLRDREQMETPPLASQSSIRNSGSRTGGKADISGTFRRLFTPREQREQTSDTKMPRDSAMSTLDSQETVQAQSVEPSPTPVSKARPSAPERQRTLTPLSIPKPLPILPSEAANRRPSVSISTNSSEKPIPRKSTSRGERPSFPVITSPSYPTTALTPHTVSTNSAAFPLVRTNSEKSTRSQVTFSRPSTMSVSAALNDIQQQHLDSERMRTTSTSSSNAEPGTSFGADKMMRAVSASEAERDNRRKTIGAKAPRASLDSSQRRISDERSALTASGTRLSTVTVHAADRSAASTILQQSAGAKRDHRRTVTDIWPQERGYA